MAGHFRLGLAQCTHPDDGDVVALVDHVMREAADRRIDLLVFPECLMTPFEKTREDFLASAQPLDGPFAHQVAHLAAQHKLWVVFTMNEKASEGVFDDDNADASSIGASEGIDAGGSDDVAPEDASPRLPFNTAVVVDAEGNMRGFYRKTHLYDALSMRESERMARGDALFAPIDTPFCKLGLGICYDLRFPEVSRAAALAGCELFVLPAAWVDGPHKADQWRVLLRARAIENEMFVAGLSRADARYIGSSCVIDPCGTVVAEAPGRQSTLVVADIDTNLIDATRAAMPVFEHRRPQLYRSLAPCADAF